MYFKRPEYTGESQSCSLSSYSLLRSFIVFDRQRTYFKPLKSITIPCSCQGTLLLAVLLVRTTLYLIVRSTLGLGTVTIIEMADVSSRETDQ